MKIGPTFSKELETAGILTLPFAWGSDGKIEFGLEMTPGQVAAVLAVVAVHDATRVPVPSASELRSAAIESMEDIQVYRIALDNLIINAAKDVDAPEAVKKAARRDLGQP